MSKTLNKIRHPHPYRSQHSIKQFSLKIFAVFSPLSMNHSSNDHGSISCGPDYPLSIAHVSGHTHHSAVGRILWDVSQGLSKEAGND